MIYHVVAVAKNGVIGKGGKLPWHFSSDLKFFKQLTTGNTVIMGRKTYDSIGKPLPNRDNIVVTHERRAPEPGVTFVTSVEAAIERVRQGETFIIGGASIYRETLALVDGIYLTRIDRDYDGDAFYPEVPEDFRKVSSQKLQDDPLIEVNLYRRT